MLVIQGLLLRFEASKTLHWERFETVPKMTYGLLFGLSEKGKKDLDESILIAKICILFIMD